LITVQEDVVQRGFTHRFCRGWTGRDGIGNSLCTAIWKGYKLKDCKLADYRISSAKHRYIPRRCCCYQSTSSLTRNELDSDPPPTFDNQEVTSSRARFPKPVHLYTPLTVFGINIVASEGEEWKKFRKIVAPTFSEVRSEHVRRLSILNANFREITSWCGTRQLGL
jgi:hypothetical protein